MSKIDALFNLVKALNNAERRSFKASAAKKKGDKLYIKLFEILEKQSTSGGEYDEDYLKKQLNNLSFSKNLSRNKNYLYELIIKFLAHSESDDLDLLFYDMMKIAKQLHERELFEAAEDYTQQIWDKTKIAEREKFEYQIMLTQWQINLFSHRYNRTGQKTELSILLKKLRSLQAANLEQNIVITKYNELMHSLGGKHIQAYNKEDKDRIIQLASSTDFRSPEKALSVIAKKNIYMMQLLSAFINRNSIDTSSIIVKAFVDMIDSKKNFFLNYHIHEYIVSLNNISFVASELKIKTLQNKCLDHYNYIINSPNFRSSKEYLKSGLDLRIFIAQLGILHSQSNFTAAIELIESKKDLIYGNNQYVNPKRKKNILTSVTIIYMLVGDFKKGLEINNLSQRLTTDSDLKDQLLRLIICYELQEFFLFDSVFRATERTLKKGSKFESQAENFIFEFFQKLQKINHSKKDIAILLLDTKNKIEAIEKIERTKNDNLEYALWVESKIQNTTMAEVLRERANA